MFTRVLEMIERIGGLEGAERKSRISELAGGDEVLEELVRQAGRCGGTVAATRQLEAVEQTKNVAEKPENLVQCMMDMAPMINVEGSQTDFAALAAHVRDNGGLKRTVRDWPDLMALKQMKKTYGSVRTLKDITAEADRIGGLEGLRKVSWMVKSFDDPVRILQIVSKSMRPLLKELCPEDQQ